MSKFLGVIILLIGFIFSPIVFAQGPYPKRNEWERYCNQFTTQQSCLKPCHWAPVSKKCKAPLQDPDSSPPQPQPEQPKCSGQNCNLCSNVGSCVGAGCQWRFDPSMGTGICVLKGTPFASTPGLSKTLQSDRAPGQSIRRVRPGQASWQSSLLRLKRSAGQAQDNSNRAALRKRLEEIRNQKNK